MSKNKDKYSKSDDEFSEEVKFSDEDVSDEFSDGFYDEGISFQIHDDCLDESEISETSDYSDCDDEYTDDDEVSDEDIYSEFDDYDSCTNESETTNMNGSCECSSGESEISDTSSCESSDEEIHDSSTDKDETSFRLSKEISKKEDDCSHKHQSEILVNCNLKVNFDTSNKIIYLYPGKSQYFTADVLKSCGDVIIRYTGNQPSDRICGNLGIYRVMKSGIFVEVYPKLNPRKNDILNFTAIDKCTNEHYDFVVIFSFNCCACCC